MGRSGYSEIDGWELIRWRGAVASAIRGKRGQSFLREMLAALDALPEKILITDELEKDGDVCALGSVGKARGLDMSKIDYEDPHTVAEAFGIPRALAAEIEFINDDDFGYRGTTPADRFQAVRKWIVNHLANHQQTEVSG